MTVRPAPREPVAAYAYVRRLPGAETFAVHRALTALTAYMERHGLALAGLYYERRVTERPMTWATLIVDCQGKGVTDVVVPSATHFHHDPAVADFMREELAEKIHGTVWYADQPVNEEGSHAR